MLALLRNCEQQAEKGRLWFVRRIIQTEPHSRWTLLVEIVAALAIVLSAGWLLILCVREMATTSLWCDEIRSLSTFTAKGPVLVTTDYRMPANHIFYNLINSLTPASASLVPWRARVWSFAAIGATLLSALIFFLRRRRILEGALFFQILGANLTTLALLLQARGYSFNVLAATLSSLAVIAFFENRARWTLVTVGVCTVLGTWSVPSYLFFAGPLLLILWLSTRDARWFYTGCLSALATALLHLPVAAQMRQQMSGYQESFGGEYRDFNAVAKTLQTYLLDLPPWALAACLLLVLLCYFYSSREQASHRAGSILLAAAGVFFIISLEMKTPPLRTTCFVVYPVAVAALLTLPTLAPGMLRPVASLGFAGSLLFANLHAIRDFHFEPYENWLGYAEYIQNHYPPGTRLFTIAKRWQFLKPYLGPAYLIVSKFDPALFEQGRMIIGDSGLIPAEQLPPGQIPADSWPHEIPQGRNFHIRIYAPIPKDSYIKKLTIQKLPAPQCLDRSYKTTWQLPSSTPPSDKFALSITPQPGSSPRRLTLLYTAGQTPPRCKILLRQAGKFQRLPDRAIQIGNDYLEVTLPAGPIEKIRCELQTSSPSTPLKLLETWLSPE